MNDHVTEFLRAAAGRRFQLGIHDCGMWLAEWVLLRRGVDPGAEWRGHYRTELGLARLIKRRGGMVAHFDACLTPFGIARTDSPKRGDIAIVRAVADTASGETGGIVLGQTVALVVGPTGIVIRHRSVAPIVAAWSIEGEAACPATGILSGREDLPPPPAFRTPSEDVPDTLSSELRPLSCAAAASPQTA